MGRLDGKVAIVTGGGSGIGEAICLKFAKEGASVVVADIGSKLAKSVSQKVKKLGRESYAHHLDVTKHEEVREMVQRAVEKFGTIDILVTSAGIARFGRIEDISIGDWEDHINVNLNGLFYCCFYVGKEMIKKRRGKIVNISSMAGMVGVPNFVGYVASKHGVVGVTRALAIDLGKYNINVNCMCPGTTVTPLVEKEYTKEYLRNRSRLVPLGRLSSTEDQANVALFLASEESDYVNGLIMNIDGGMYSLFSGYAPSFLKDRTP